MTSLVFPSRTLLCLCIIQRYNLDLFCEGFYSPINGIIPCILLHGCIFFLICLLCFLFVRFSWIDCCYLGAISASFSALPCIAGLAFWREYFPGSLASMFLLISSPYVWFRKWRRSIGHHCFRNGQVSSSCGWQPLFLERMCFLDTPLWVIRLGVAEGWDRHWHCPVIPELPDFPSASAVLPIGFCSPFNSCMSPKSHDLNVFQFKLPKWPVFLTKRWLLEYFVQKWFQQIVLQRCCSRIRYFIG